MMTYDSISETGKRENNEDSCAIVSAKGATMYVVADGLGGHGRGEVASSTVTKSIAEYLEGADTAIPDAIDKLVEEAICYSQEKLLKQQAVLHARNEMKTTIVVLASVRDKICWGHVGDSRLYAFRKNKVAERTFDHSIPQMLVLSGELSEKKIRNHPQRNMLLRVLGIEWESPQFKISEVKNTDDYQAFLLCSDGFWELITEKEMCKLLKKSTSVSDWLHKMTEYVKDAGKACDMDNYTAIAIWA